MLWHRKCTFYARWCTFQAYFVCGMTDFMCEIYGRFLMWQDWDTRLFFCILRAFMHIPSTFYVWHDWFHVWDAFCCVTCLRYVVWKSHTKKISLTDLTQKKIVSHRRVTQKNVRHAKISHKKMHLLQILCVTWLRYKTNFFCVTCLRYVVWRVTWLRYVTHLMRDMLEINDVLQCVAVCCGVLQCVEVCWSVLYVLLVNSMCCLLIRDTTAIHDWFHVWHEWNGTHVIGYLYARWRTFQAHFMCDMTDFMGV